MKNISVIISLVAWLLELPGVLAHNEEECVEVGFARASYLTVDQGYKAAKEALVSLWQDEDKNGSPSYRDFSPQIKNVTRASVLLEETSKNIIGLIRKTRVGKRCREEWLLKGIEKHVTPLIQLDKDFAEELGLVMSFRCLVGSPFPNVDGTCINEEGPDMGAIGSKFLRLLTPTPGTGGFQLRGSVNKEKKLVSSREVARVIRSHLQRPSVTALLTEFSHFISLDTFSIPESPRTENVNCCENKEHVDCEPIFLEEDDPMYSTIKCFNFKRSVPAQAILGNRESLSVISTYLDATPVYGATNEIAFSLKEGYFGYLKYPSSVDDVEEESEVKKKIISKNCQFPKSFKGCFNLDPKESGYIDNLRLLLILEHNYIADALTELNPHFDDALLYNEARRILIAEYNAIVYGEVVPLLVGKELAEKHQLLPGTEGPTVKFIPEVNPGILTSFALAAYRNPAMIDEWKKEWGPTDILFSHHYHSIREDPYQDFLAMDIQRGRDHALPSYSAWRSFCDSGKQIESWEDLEKILDGEVVNKLRKIYQEEVNDVDLLVSLLEKPEEGAIVGKIFSCILVDQFARLKTGNRLYWEHETSLLTKEQRDTILTHASSAALLCRHMGIEKVPQNAFKVVDESNPEIECSSIPNFNLSAWTDTSLIEVMKKKKEEEKMGVKQEPIQTGEVEAGQTQEENNTQPEIEMDEREKEREQIRQSLLKEEVEREERKKGEEKVEIEEKEEQEEMTEHEKYKDEMQRAEERIREEMRMKEEKRGKRKEDGKSTQRKKSKMEL